MTNGLKSVVYSFTMLGLLFGFAHLVSPGPNGPPFDRLHIFLFNLVAGGTLIMHYTEGKERFSGLGALYFFLSLAFTLAAFFQAYVLCLLLGLALFGVVETIRNRRFSFFPFSFFQARARVADNFHHASVLCLSIGLLIASFAVANENWLHWVQSEKLTLDVFFLGFSFPLSLITLHRVFLIIDQPEKGLARAACHAVFWVINAGVIIFFTFILAGWPWAEILISCILLAGILTAIRLLQTLSRPGQDRTILFSGLGFLVATALTGIFYILLTIPNQEYNSGLEFFLQTHAFYSLYGWNFSGLAVVARQGDFPLAGEARPLVEFHWLVVAIACPLGYYLLPMAGVAWFLFGVAAWHFLFRPKESKPAIPSQVTVQ